MGKPKITKEIERPMIPARGSLIVRPTTMTIITDAPMSSPSAMRKLNTPNKATSFELKT
jgi:hypothetical protein